MCIFKEVLRETVLSDRIEFISELVDMFYRIAKDCRNTIRFEDLTTYLIDHEIAFDSENGTKGGANTGNISNIEYHESALKDPSTHNNYIE